MLAVLTAFVSLVFAYFFFWTIHDDFPPDPSPGPGAFWPVAGGVAALAAWGLVLLARSRNRTDAASEFYASLIAASVLAIAGGAALVVGPSLAGLDPTSHVYPATVWLLLIWSAAHMGLGVLMNGYCFARRLSGKMDGAHDIDIANVTLYWHFCILTVLTTVAVIAGFPVVA
jgi:cytochrome c oxidase subunit I+III